jgi:hypothetical protein
MKRRNFLKTLVLATPTLYLSSFPAISALNSKVFNINLSTPGRFSFYIDYSELSTPGQHVFYVCRTHGTQGNVSVDYSTHGDPHTASNGTISFAAGELGVKSFTVDVPTKSNGDHRIYAKLSNPTGGTVLHNGSKTIAYGVIDDGTIASDSDAVFFDADAVTNGSGTQVSPYDNIYDAISNVGSKRYIYGKGAFTPSQSILFGGGSAGNGIPVPDTRTSELNRLYIRNWPGSNLEVNGGGVSGTFGFYGNSGNSYHTYRGIEFSQLNMTGLGTPCFCIAYHYGDSTDINIEHCTADDINGGFANNGAFLLYGVDGGKVWRCETNNIQTESDNSHGNTGGVYSYKGKNLSVQRCEFTNSYNGLYHKQIDNAGDTSTAYKFNYNDTPIGAHYGASGSADPGHSYAIIQSNIFKNCYDAGVRHSPGQGQTDTNVSKSFYVTNNVFDACGTGTVGSIYTTHGYENIIFNNIFIDCRSTWSDKNDTTAIKNPTVEYADYNNDFGTTLTRLRYQLSGVGYESASSLPGTLGKHDTQLEPFFVNTDENIYWLDTDSNCIANGVDGTDQGVYLLNIEIIGVNEIFIRPAKVTNLQVI